MHAEYRYICNHHPCLPVEMLRNYKERSHKQTNKKELKKKKKKELNSGGKATNHPTVLKVNSTPILDYLQWNLVQTAVPGLFSSYINARSMHIPLRVRPISNEYKHHDQIKLIFFSKRKISISMLLLAEHTLAIGVYDIIQFHQIIWPCGMEGSFWDGIIMALFFTVRSWVLRSECAWLAQEAKALRAGKHR